MKVQTSNPNARVAITIANTDKPLMDWLKQNFGGRVFKRKNWSPQSPSRRVLDSYEWRCCSIGDGYPLLLRVEKYLVSKKWKARTVIKFCRDKMREHGYDPDVDYAALRAKYLTSESHTDSHMVVGAVR